jgi:hypothetical protein
MRNEKTMTLNQFQKKCVESEPKYLTRGDEALIGLMGLNSASGKCIDIYKKALYEDQELDRERLAKELGHIARFVAMVANSMDYKLEDILDQGANEEK